MDTSDNPIKVMHYATVGCVFFALAFQMPIFYNIAGGLMFGCALGTLLSWKIQVKDLEESIKLREDSNIRMEAMIQIVEKLKKLRDELEEQEKKDKTE